MGTQVLDRISSDSPSIEKIVFDGGVIEVVRHGGHGWFWLGPLCNAIGINVRAQQQRIGRQPWAVACMIHGTATDGKVYEMQCLRADCLAMFLATLEVSRIRNGAARRRIAKYQKNAAAALDRWLRGREHDAEPAALPPSASAPIPRVEVVDAVTLPQPVLNELLAELRANREAQGVHLNLLMQVTQRIAGPQQQVPALVQAAPEQPASASPRPAKKPRTKPAPQPELAAEFVSGAQVAAELGIAPSTFSHWLKAHNGIRKLQRPDGKWPLVETVAEYRAVQERAAKREEERKPAVPNRSELRNGIVMWVRGYCGALKMTGEQIAEVWNNIYVRFAVIVGYDPREHKGKGQRALDVVEERGHLAELDRVAMQVCPPRVLADKAMEAAQMDLPKVGHA